MKIQRLGGVDGRRLRASRVTLGDHEIVTAPEYCGKWLVDENKWRRVKQPYQKQICNNRIGDLKTFISRYCRCNKELFLCSEFYGTHFLDADTQELNHQLIS